MPVQDLLFFHIPRLLLLLKPLLRHVDMSKPVLDRALACGPENPLDERAGRYQCRYAKRNCGDDKRRASSMAKDAPDRQLATLGEDASS